MIIKSKRYKRISMNFHAVNNRWN